MNRTLALPMRPKTTFPVLLLTTVLATLLSLPLAAATATVAAATNFRATLNTLVATFERTSAHRLRLVSSSTGVLYNQILHGAPFDLLLAADSEHPLLLEKNALGHAGSRFTYATGTLALVFTLPPIQALDSAHPQPAFAALLGDSVGKIALANPALAPYGLASRQVLKHLGLWQSLQSRLVMGNSVAQSHQFVATGNSPLGFIALAQAYSTRPALPYWPVPPSWHRPIQQQAILLQSGHSNPAAVDFHRFLSSPVAVAIIRGDGYLVATTTEKGQ